MIKIWLAVRENQACDRATVEANVTRCRQLTVENKTCRDLPSDLTVE